MPEWFTVAAAIIALGGGSFGAVNGYRTMRRTSPVEEIRKESLDRWKAFYADKWDRAIERIERVEETVRNVDSDRTHSRFSEIDEKLANDNRRLKVLEEGYNDTRRCLRLLLRSQQQLLEHEISGNHAERLRESADDIAEYLVERL